ncbi:Ppx/GppA phosphatase family protein [Terracoccus luteus]|jgi:exopolyphosphatase/guanosine-5'-triphosphate,3'-diphosphate pyrophosphatase|uniref:Exopolyphosphatase/guanosine-5'-triphosphate, 3'-diphosphate pyrophosphatase n=1 Tax=Terracoccus luteus TaxID=53356 RepID=A0A839PPJ5_9MICO|nr:Ppx/GppA phosphatase family protein [Terracoccus luteus]MBB2986218.1 exopolyphosphatase/guanosine-5'-triphosphate,3'-diphosphate pyrophosphatase [Terracoccus luteus]MCP2172192.1 exopolyphosphatase/guanosine-5'-triphosphate,3'-diphosphate pyrophosphatase [Terracoccus luteus]
MRLGVIDIGSNTVHLLVVDAYAGAHPLPASSHKTELRLSESTRPDGSIDPATADRLVAFIGECLVIAEDQGVHDLFAFATSALREAPNGPDVIARVRAETGVDLETLTGSDEARMTFLAVRRWFGWSSGRLLVVDIGGGSLELAGGLDEEPDVAVSLPLGAGRVTRERLPGDPPTADELRAVRGWVRTTLAEQLRPLLTAGPPDRAVGTSKTLRSLARIAGAAPREEGPFVPRHLTRDDLAVVVEKLAGMDAVARTSLPAVSVGRAHQLLAGALVAQAAMDLLQLERLDICPWALREGLILRRLDHLAGA